MPLQLSIFFFFNDTATTEIYTLSLHDALPIGHGGDLRRREAAAAEELVLFDRHRSRDRPAGADRPLPDDEELRDAVLVDVGGENLLRVRVAGRVDDRLLPAALPVLVHPHLARLLLVELVRLARRREDLERPVAVDVAELDLVHERVGLMVDLVDLPALRRMHDRDHALVVRRDDE